MRSWKEPEGQPKRARRLRDELPGSRQPQRIAQRESVGLAAEQIGCLQAHGNSTQFGADLQSGFEQIAGVAVERGIEAEPCRADITQTYACIDGEVPA